MKVKVLEAFTDKHTQKRHEINEVFECTDERFAEIQSVSKKLVEAMEEPKTESETEPESNDAEEPAKKEPAKRTKTKVVKE